MIATSSKSDIGQNKDIAAFAYVLVFAPVLLVTRRDSVFIQHHALQATYLGVLLVLFILLPGRLSYLNILVAAAALMGFLEAQAGNKYNMPIISDLIAKNINFRSGFGALKRFFLYLGSILKRVFTEGPGFAIRGTAEVIEKARGIDALKIHGEVEDLKKTVQHLEEELKNLKGNPE